MTFFSTILQSNNAGRRSLLDQWLEDHRFFIGIDEEDVKIVVNDDLSLTIESVYSRDIMYPDITINEIPPHGIRELRKFHEVHFVNVKELDIHKLPRFHQCKSIHMDYCTLPKEYINEKMSYTLCNLV